jgi:hypothetical protein
MPYYIVYFTEQEIFGFLKASLENAGLVFNEGDVIPNYLLTIEDTVSQRLPCGDCLKGLRTQQEYSLIYGRLPTPNQECEICKGIFHYSLRSRRFNNFELSLYDSEKNIAIAKVGRLPQTTKTLFEKQAVERGDDIKFGVFTISTVYYGPLSRNNEGIEKEWYDLFSLGRRPTDFTDFLERTKEHARNTIEADLERQVNEFIKLLQEEGIL